jgi:hypothetical protein
MKVKAASGMCLPATSLGEEGNSHITTAILVYVSKEEREGKR